MLKNIWYCIKKTSEWYFALLVLYIILTLVNATIPILSVIIPGASEPSVRTLRATIPENESQPNFLILV